MKQGNFQAKGHAANIILYDFIDLSGQFLRRLRQLAPQPALQHTAGGNGEKAGCQLLPLRILGKAVFQRHLPDSAADDALGVRLKNSLQIFVPQRIQRAQADVPVFGNIAEQPQKALLPALSIHLAARQLQRLILKDSAEQA